MSLLDDFLSGQQGKPKSLLDELFPDRQPSPASFGTPQDEMLGQVEDQQSWLSKRMGALGAGVVGLEQQGRGALLAAQAAGNALEAFPRGLQHAQAGALGLQSAASVELGDDGAPIPSVGPLPPIDSPEFVAAEESGLAKHRDLAAAADALRPQRAGATFGEDFRARPVTSILDRVLESAPGTAAAMGATAIHPALGVGAAMTLEGGSVYPEARSAGVDRATALGGAVGTGVVGGLLEYAGVDELMRVSKLSPSSVAGWLTGIGRSMASEGLTESAQEVNAVLWEIQQGRDPGDVLGRVLESTVVGAASGGGITAASTSSATATNLLEPARARASEEGRVRDKLAAILESPERREERSPIDELTGLSNQSAWLRAKEGIEADPDTAIVAVDLDGLKAVNDNAGHEVADAKLFGPVSAAIRETAKEYGVSERRAFRAGGDEFRMAVPADIANRFASSLRKRIGTEFVDVGDGRFAQTGASIGFGPTDSIAEAGVNAEKATKPERGKLLTTEEMAAATDALAERYRSITPESRPARPRTLEDRPGEAGAIGALPEFKPAFEFDAPGAEQDLRRGQGYVEPRTLKQRLGDAVSSTWAATAPFREAFSRTHKHIPRDGFHAVADDAFRQVDHASAAAVRDTHRDLALTFRGVTAQSYDTFQRFMAANTAQATLEKLGPGAKLPNKWTAETLPADLEKAALALQADPGATKLFEDTQSITSNARERLRAARDVLGLSTDWLDSYGVDYFHHQYVDADLPGSISGQVGIKRRRGYQRQRTGSDGALDVRYESVMGPVITQMHADAQALEQVARIRDAYDIRAELSAIAAEKNGVDRPALPARQLPKDVAAQHAAVLERAKEAAGRVEGREAKIRDLIPEGYVKWHPDAENITFLAPSIPDRIAQEAIERGMAEVLGKDVREIRASAPSNNFMIIPENVAAQLDEINDVPHRNATHRAHLKAVGGFKWMAIRGPSRIVRYAIRNIIGDTSGGTLTWNPAALKEVPRASADLAGYLWRGQDMTPDLKAFAAQGGMDANLYQQVLDLDERSRQAVINHMKGVMSQQGPGRFLSPKAALRTYNQLTDKALTYFETINRYANFRQKRMEIAATGTVQKYLASDPKMVDALIENGEPDAAAFKLANELIGAYDSVSTGGRELAREVAPFWAFTELNFRKHMQIARNLANDHGVAAAMLKKYLPAVGKGALRSTPGIAIRAGVFLGLAASFELMLKTVNSGFFGAFPAIADAEDDLPQSVKDTPHIILGRNDDGSVRYFNRLSVFAEAREWFGLDHPERFVADYLNGKMTAAEVATEMLATPFVKAWNAVGPTTGFGAKLALELITGKQTFPDFREPRQIHDVKEYITQTMGAEDVFRTLANTAAKAEAATVGEPGRPPLFRVRPSRDEGPFSWLPDTHYTSDPGEAAYADAWGLKNQFLRSIGEEQRSTELSPRSQALRQMKRAMRFEQPDLYALALDEYVALSGELALTPELNAKINASLMRMHPLSGLTEDQRVEFDAWLTQDDRQRLDDAIKFWEEVYKP